jgi:3'-phosphoadenosine 5'-phosphosulfate sulfotransferase (PAPS reductase)/FAD synthetase
LTNPLHEQGYPSVGCHPCTSPVKAGESERSGRWRGSQKTECGLHVRQESTSGQERLRVLQGGQP